jgi:hypothetical protein
VRVVFGKALASVMAGSMALGTAQVLPDQRPGCFRNALSVSTNAGSQPTVHATGVQGVESATIQVNADADLRGGYFFYSLGQAKGDSANAPSYAWRLDGGGWRSGSLSAGFSGSTWSAAPGYLGDLAAGSDHTLEFAITFTSADQAGTYSGDVRIGSYMCGSAGTDGPLSLAFTPAASTPAHSSPSATPSHSASPSASPSPSPSPSSSSPSASPSPSQTPLILATALADHGTPVAAVKAGVSGGGGGGALALVLAALVMLLGLVMGFAPRAVRYRRLRMSEAGTGAGPGPGAASGGGEPVQ